MGTHLSHFTGEKTVVQRSLKTSSRSDSVSGWQRTGSTHSALSSLLLCKILTHKRQNIFDNISSSIAGTFSQFVDAFVRTAALLALFQRSKDVFKWKWNWASISILGRFLNIDFFFHAICSRICSYYSVILRYRLAHPRPEPSFQHLCVSQPVAHRVALSVSGRVTSQRCRGWPWEE